MRAPATGEGRVAKQALCENAGNLQSDSRRGLPCWRFVPADL